MSVFDIVRIVIYRVHEKGLEVFLMNEDDLSTDPDVWQLPSGRLEHQIKDQIKNLIELDSSTEENGVRVKNIAVEADWHEIPSVRGLVKHDVKLVKSKIKQAIPNMEKGTYFVVKDAFKKVLPNEYQALKELKDIVLDRNALTNI